VSEQDPIDRAPDSNGALSSAEMLEADLSALVDGELEPARLLAVIDRLVEEPRSRDFYRRARALDGLVEATEPLPRSEAPHEVWQRIASSTGQAPATLPFRARAGSRPWSKLLAPVAAAAAVVLAISLGIWMNSERPRVAARDQHADVALETSDITIGGREGQMTDERFLAIATEILEADRRYRREMAEIIDLVESALPSEMGTAEPSRLGEETSLVSDEIDTAPDGRVDRDLDVRLW
jgi:negative regulator of sigma E activity